MRLGYGRPKYRERFEAQIRALRRVADTCKVQIGLSPSTLPLPRSLYLRRREDPSEVSVCFFINVSTYDVTPSLATTDPSS